MSLTDALLLEPHPFDIWIANRTDGIKGSGTARAQAKFDAAARDNVIGYYNGGTDVRDRSIAVTVIRGDSALVGGNVINLLSSYPGVGSDYRIREHTAKAVDIRHNTTAIGEVIPGLNTNDASASPPQLVPLPDAYNGLVSDISDGALLSFL